MFYYGEGTEANIDGKLTTDNVKYATIMGNGNESSWGTKLSSKAAFSTTKNGDGETTTGAAVAVAPYTGETRAITLNIFGGTFDAAKALSYSNPNKVANPDVTINVTGGTFSDIGAERWYAGATAWGSASKVVSGTDDGRFLPEAQITREQLAVMLYNYAKLTGKQMKTGGAAFEDSTEISPWAAEAMDVMTASGILGGDAEGRLRPKSSATRAETAVILKRFLNNLSIWQEWGC